MRLLAISTLGDVAGGESTLLRALPALAGRGYTTRLAVPSDGALRATARKRDIATVRIPLGPPDRLTAAAPLGLGVAPLHLARTDVVWLNGPPTQRLVPALALTGRRAVLRVNNPLLEAPAWWRALRATGGSWWITVPSRATGRSAWRSGRHPS